MKFVVKIVSRNSLGERREHIQFRGSANAFRARYPHRSLPGPDGVYIWEQTDGYVLYAKREEDGLKAQGGRVLLPSVDARPYTGDERSAALRYHCDDCDPKSQGKRCRCNMMISPTLHCQSQREATT